MNFRSLKPLVCATTLGLVPSLAFAQAEIGFSVLSMPYGVVGRDATLILEHLNEKGWDTQEHFRDFALREAWLEGDLDFPWVAANDILFEFLERQDSDSFLGLWQSDEAVAHGFDSAYLRINHHDAVIRLGLAWVPFDQDQVLDENECGPPEDWNGWQCIEKSDSKFTVKMKAGHPGFEVFEIAAHRWLFEDSERDRDHDLQALEELADDDLSETLSRTWLLTATGNGRKVDFELYRPGDTEPYRTAEGDRARPGGRIDSDGNGVPRNTCGGAAAACPMFYELDDVGVINEIRELVEESCYADGWAP